MKLITCLNKQTQELPEMFCFGGINTTIEISKIKTVEQVFYEDYTLDEYIPVLRITMQDGAQIMIDYETEQEAKEALNEYKKYCKIKRVK